MWDILDTLDVKDNRVRLDRQDNQYKYFHVEKQRDRETGKHNDRQNRKTERQEKETNWHTTTQIQTDKR
jgi:hypothetical protein